jgi:spermidine synthase
VIWYFLFFLVSGFCGILYELVWLRLAMAQFGVTTALVSIVLSMFMAGLGVGSWAAGMLIRRFDENPDFPPLRLYALCELFIGTSALLVPLQLLWGHRIIEWLSGQSGISSGVFYLVAGAWLALTLIPWCACMGATIPLAMFAIRRDFRSESQRSFSFLYVANLVGAVAGALLPLLFIEAFGFRGALHIGMGLNIAVAVFAAILSVRPAKTSSPYSARSAQPTIDNRGFQKGGLLLLFLTGLITMGMEVVWIRLFTPSIGPMVYSFALILASYLFATFVGSRIYRAWSRSHSMESSLVWVTLSLLGLLPLITSDLRLGVHPSTRVFAGVMPFACVIGFLTPMLIDRWSQGNPGRAGRAYAVNVLGCILGPLVAGFLLLPWFGERVSMLIFIMPFFLMAIFPVSGDKLRPAARAGALAIVAAAIVIFIAAKDFETLFPTRVVLRDSAATVIATGTANQKQLLVNGIPMTGLRAVTKLMAHLTLASSEHPPQNTLVICFGMGTTFRSALSWGVPATVVDLIPSVPKLFSYYHQDASQVLASPNAHVIVDDGRRFLERTSQTFDSIIVDPPPPAPAAGSSLLYSKEFYVLVKQHLRTDGIFQQWLPEGDAETQSAVAHALKDSFPYVRAFGYPGDPGLQFLASMSPIAIRTPTELVERMPASAVSDLIEWTPQRTPESLLRIPVSNELALDTIIRRSPGTPALQDDRPVNEYYFLRTPCDECIPGIEALRKRLYSGLGAFLESAADSTVR